MTGDRAHTRPNVSKTRERWLRTTPRLSGANVPYRLSGAKREQGANSHLHRSARALGESLPRQRACEAQLMAVWIVDVEVALAPRRVRR